MPNKQCEENIQCTHVECIDHSDAGCGVKLELTVVSPDFEGMMPLKRHRTINALLKTDGLMDSIHALTINAWTPAQWEEKRKLQGATTYQTDVHS